MVATCKPDRMEPAKRPMERIEDVLLSRMLIREGDTAGLRNSGCRRLMDEFEIRSEAGKALRSGW